MQLGTLYLDFGQLDIAGLPKNYDSILVAASFAIALVAAYSALLSVERSRTSRLAFARIAWLIAGAVTSGVGIWAGNYIGLLALRPPQPLLYDAVGSLLVLLLSGAVVLAALRVVTLPRLDRRHVLAGGVIAGCGLVATVVVALTTVRGTTEAHLNGVWALGALVVAIGVAVVLLKYRVGGEVQKKFKVTVGTTLLLALALIVAHYATLAGVRFVPASGAPTTSHTLDRVAVTALVSVTGLLVVFLTILAAVVDRHLQAAYAAARISRTLLENASDSLPDALTILDSRGYLALANAEARRLFPAISTYAERTPHFDEIFPAALDSGLAIPGYTYGSFADLSSRRDNNAQSEHPLRDGRILLVRDQRTQSGGFIIAFADVTEDRRMQRELERMALNDSLTGLPNRNLFEDRLHLAAAHVRRHGGTFGLLYIDFDLFKPVNDMLGHEGGDEALREVGRRLNQLLRATDTAARIGGDEFAIILQPEVNAEVVSKIAERLIRTLQHPIIVKGRECRVGASVGIAIHPSDSEDLTILVQSADKAMFRAKQSGGNRYALASAGGVSAVVT